MAIYSEKLLRFVPFMTVIDCFLLVYDHVKNKSWIITFDTVLSTQKIVSTHSLYHECFIYIATTALVIFERIKKCASHTRILQQSL